MNHRVATDIFFVLHSYDLNGILMECTKNRDDAEMERVFEKYHARVEEVSIKPRMNLLDNECLEAIVSFFARVEVDYQLVPPGCHQANDAGRSPQRGKHHIISSIMTTDPLYHVTEWDKLVKQGEWSLNMLRPSCVSPKI